MAMPLSRYELSLNSVFALSLYCTKDTCLGRNKVNFREEESLKRKHLFEFLFTLFLI